MGRPVDGGAVGVDPSLATLRPGRAGAPTQQRGPELRRRLRRRLRRPESVREHERRRARTRRRHRRRAPADADGHRPRRHHRHVRQVQAVGHPRRDLRPWHRVGGRLQPRRREVADVAEGARRVRPASRAGMAEPDPRLLRPVLPRPARLSDPARHRLRDPQCRRGSEPTDHLRHARSVGAVHRPRACRDRREGRGHLARSRPRG